MLLQPVVYKEIKWLAAVHHTSVKLPSVDLLSLPLVASRYH